ncbi:MAG: hypothetical protein U0L76_09430 [Ruminococcus sp.]|nr:hypothetical protein [Ruminococcus sp.]
MKSSTVPNRKTGRMIAKNLIILLVLIVVTVLSILAWFTKGDKAEASGINVQAKASGVQVSWDDEKFYDNLTALTEEAMKEDTTGKTGMAKFLTSDGTVNGKPAPLKLVTGNGLKFFEPLLNRRTGTVLTNGAVWQGADISSENSAGKYIDIPLYFKSDTAKEIYLAGDSKVYPKSKTERISDYGDFSKDYICAASRVAFLNEVDDGLKCNYIWAPNSNYKLAEDANGYTKVTDLHKDESAGSGIGSIPPEILTTDNEKNYYFWLPVNYITDSETIFSEYTPIPMEFTKYSGDKGLFTCTFTIHTPSRDNPSIPFFISQNGTSWSSSDFANVNINNSQATNESSDLDPRVAISNQTYNLAGSATSIFFLSGFNLTETEVTFGYNPTTGTTIVLKYSGGSESYDRTGSGTTVTITYYEMENNAGVVLANVDSAVAVSSNTDGKKSIRFKDSSKLNILPSSVTKSEFFTAKKTGEGAEATYQFQNVSTNKYLTVNNGDVSLSASGSVFTLAYIEGFDSPALKCGDYYLIYNGRKFAAYTIESFDTNDLATVFTGSSYRLLTNSESETYKYYDSATNTEVTLNENSTPPLFATATDESETTKVGDTPILTLTKASDDAEFYTGKIIMRVWAEGTDRDALTPLADGIFDLSLHFTSK